MKLEVEYISIDDIKPYEKNAKIHTEEQIEQIKKSIQEFGMNDPIGIWRDNIIIEGHGRLMACKELGMQEVPVIRLDDLTDDQRKAYTLIHNQTTMNTGFDLDILNEELASIDLDMSDFGFDEIELDDIEEEQEIVEDEVPEVSEEPKAKLGDIYQLGNHRLMCGDSTSEEDVSKLMDGVKADMVFTDPPYGMNLDSSFGGMSYNPNAQYKVKKNYSDVIGDKDDFKPELITTVFDNFGYCKEIFLWGADYFAELLSNKNNGSWLVWDKRAKIEDLEWTTSEFELCWSKNKHHREILRHTWHGLVGLSSEDTKKRIHPTQKPISMIIECFNKWGKDKINIVDLYGGSGSTLIACEQLNRKCYMMELDPHYIDVIIQRWENFTGEKAVLLNE